MWRRGYTVILALVAALVAYELFAAFAPGWPTISESVWSLTARWPWVRWAGTGLAVLLVLHFWFGLWAPDRTKR
jgi:hypothetical protein